MQKLPLQGCSENRRSQSLDRTCHWTAILEHRRRWPQSLPNIDSHAQSHRHLQAHKQGSGKRVYYAKMHYFYHGMQRVGYKRQSCPYNDKQKQTPHQISSETHFRRSILAHHRTCKRCHLIAKKEARHHGCQKSYDRSNLTDNSRTEAHNQADPNEYQ